MMQPVQFVQVGTLSTQIMELSDVESVWGEKTNERLVFVPWAFETGLKRLYVLFMLLVLILNLASA
jgi:hypothetical protein